MDGSNKNKRELKAANLQNELFGSNSSISIRPAHSKETKQMNMKHLQNGPSKKEIEVYQNYFNQRFYKPHIVERKKKKTEEILKQPPAAIKEKTKEDLSSKFVQTNKNFTPLQHLNQLASMNSFKQKFNSNNDYNNLPKQNSEKDFSNDICNIIPSSESSLNCFNNIPKEQGLSASKSNMKNKGMKIVSNNLEIPLDITHLVSFDDNDKDVSKQETKNRLKTKKDRSKSTLNEEAAKNFEIENVNIEENEKEILPTENNENLDIVECVNEEPSEPAEEQCTLSQDQSSSMDEELLTIKEEVSEHLNTEDTNLFKEIKNEMMDQIIAEAKLEPEVKMQEYDEEIKMKKELEHEELLDELLNGDNQSFQGFENETMHEKTSDLENNIEILNQKDEDDIFVAPLPTVKRDGRDKKLYPCKICNKVYSHYKSRYRHMWLHKGIRPYTCHTCNKGFMSKSHLRDHIRTHTNEKPFKCHVCDKSFVVNSTLKTHMRVHTGEKRFACDLCGERFVYRERMLAHMRKHNNEKPYPCEICDKRLTSKYLLSIHMKAHAGLRPFKCDQCDKSFVLRRKLNVHVRIHSAEESFKCETCGKIFSEKYRLTTHMRTHTGERPFPCTICGKSFKENGVLTYHMRIHLGEKSYRCEVCNKCFYDKSQLTKHQKCHTGLRPYSCPLCDTKFSRQQSVARHMKLHNKGGKIRKKTIKKPEAPQITDQIIEVKPIEVSKDSENAHNGIESNVNMDKESYKNSDSNDDPLQGPESYQFGEHSIFKHTNKIIENS